MPVIHAFDDEVVAGLRADGTPDPEYAQQLGLLPAPAVRRSLAFALDAAIWLALSIPTMLGLALLLPSLLDSGVLPADASTALILIAVGVGSVTVFGIVQLILHGLRGLTVGKAAFGLRSVDVARFGPPGFWRVVLRVLVLWASEVVVPIIGPAVMFASGLWDPAHRGRSWLDRIGRAWVVDVRRGVNPLDVRSMRQARRSLAVVAATFDPRMPSLATGSETEVFTGVVRSRAGVIGAAAMPETQWPELQGAGLAVHTHTQPHTASEPQTQPQPRAERLITSAPLEPSAPLVASAPMDLLVSEAPAPAVAPQAELVFEDGSRHRVAGVGLIGRDPTPRTGEAVDRLLAIEDPSMRISKTHASFGVDGHGFWISDRASTNGTSVLDGDDWRELPAGQSVRLPWGSTVQVGGRTMRVALVEGDR